tara:strand:+ start:44485 stop:45273 length:789 start_codon:yes stop_codon:yes gene_type:complete
LTTSLSIFDLWSPLEVEQDSSVLWQCGNLTLYVRRLEYDWLIASSYADEDTDEMRIEYDAEFPEGLEFQRYALNQDTSHLRFIPNMPRRPLLFRPNHPLVLPSQAKILFYVSIPLWITPVLGQGADTVVTNEIPVKPPSDSWFGEHTEGQLCFALRTFARRRLDAFSVSPHRAICPVLIHNQSSLSLDCVQVCLRAKYLNIYQGIQRLWTNQVSVHYHGTHLLSNVSYATKPPTQARTPMLLTAAIEHPPHNFLLKTFGLSE